MYTPIELLQRAYYSARYAMLEKSGGKNPALMLDSCFWYLNMLEKYYPEQYENASNTIKSINDLIGELLLK